MKIDTPLLPHQKDAVSKLQKIKIGALYMEQGTGKTCTGTHFQKDRQVKSRCGFVVMPVQC